MSNLNFYDDDKLSSAMSGLENKHLEAFTFHANDRKKHVTASKMLLLTIQGIGLTCLTVAAATKLFWFVPYCVLYLLGVFYMQISQR